MAELIPAPKPTCVFERVEDVTEHGQPHATGVVKTGQVREGQGAWLRSVPQQVLQATQSPSTK